MVFGMFGPHPAVPPCEIKAKVPTCVLMVHVVVSHGCQPVQQRAAVTTGREDLVAAMADGVAQHHVDREGKQRDRMRRYHQKDQREIDSVHQRLAGVKGIGRERRWVVRLVMAAVELSKQARPVDQPVRPVKPGIVRDDQDDG